MQVKGTVIWSPLKYLNGEFYLQTQAGGWKKPCLSLLVNNARGIKNPGWKEIRSAPPFCEMYKHALAPLTPEKSWQEAAFLNGPAFFR